MTACIGRRRLIPCSSAVTVSMSPHTMDGCDKDAVPLLHNDPRSCGRVALWLQMDIVPRDAVAKRVGSRAIIVRS